MSDDNNSSGTPAFPDAQGAEVGERSAGMPHMFALFASALNRNWEAMPKLQEFPQAEGGAGEGPGKPAGLAGMPMQAMESWKMFGDAMQGAFDAAVSGQQATAEQMSRAMSATFKAFTGLDPTDMLKGVGGDWSPKQVAFRSLGIGDGDAMAKMAEMTQLATATGETARAAMNLHRIVNDAWLRAAQAFAKTQSGFGKARSDPVELHRAWVKTAEPILQDMLRSKAFVEAQAELVRTGVRRKQAKTALAKRFTKFIEAPHRQEMNEAYEAIQELRREVRTLRRNQKRLEEALKTVTADAPQKAM